MRTGSLSVFTTVVIGAGSFGLASALAGAPSPAELIDLAPVIRSSDEDCRSIEITGYIKDKGVALINFRAIYRAPDRFGFFIKDGADGTPLLFSANGKMFIYDPVRPVVLYLARSATNFSIRQEGDRFIFAGEWSQDQEARSSILFDVRSLFSETAESDEVVETGDERYRLTRTSPRGNRLVFWIDRRRSCPFTGLDIVMKDSDEPCVCVSKIAVNEGLPDEEFAFPEKSRLAKKIAVRDWPGDGFLKGVSGMALIFRACYARLAANQPDLRDAIPLPGLTGIDWDNVKKNDREFSRILKKIVAVHGVDESAPRIKANRR